MARQRTPEGPPPAPAVQKLRVRYAKRGRLRFSSTRDFARALERALRRADVPMAFSGGFHPHPLISYANAAPTGTASEAEYFEIRVTERVDPEAVRAALDEALPDGLDVVEVVEAGPGALADRLEGSEWRIVLRGVDPEPVADAVASYLACERAEATRTFKTGPRTFDTRGAVLDDGDPRGRRGGVCDTSGGRAAHHTVRTPRRHPDRTARSDRVLATGPTPGDPAGARASARRSCWGGRPVGRRQGRRRLRIGAAPPARAAPGQQSTSVRGAPRTIRSHHAVDEEPVRTDRPRCGRRHVGDERGRHGFRERSHHPRAAAGREAEAPPGDEEGRGCRGHSDGCRRGTGRRRGPLRRRRGRGPGRRRARAGRRGSGRGPRPGEAGAQARGKEGHPQEGGQDIRRGRAQNPPGELELPAPAPAPEEATAPTRSWTQKPTTKRTTPTRQPSRRCRASAWSSRRPNRWPHAGAGRPRRPRRRPSGPTTTRMPARRRPRPPRPPPRARQREPRPRTSGVARRSRARTTVTGAPAAAGAAAEDAVAAARATTTRAGRHPRTTRPAARRPATPAPPTPASRRRR